MSQFGHWRPDAAKEVRRSWHELADGVDHPVWREIGSVLGAYLRDGSVPSSHEVQMRLGELLALIEEAERGQLRGGGWDDVRRDPLLWELRLTFGENPDNDLLVRGYFHEPSECPLQTVLAKLHVKDVTSNDSATIADLQDAQIDEAGDRVRDCAGDDWGLGHSHRLVERLGTN